MSKPVKYFLIATASLGILIVAAILTITALVDVEGYKPKIEQLVTEKTGYPLTLGGEISLSLFPWVGLSFTELQLDNPQGFVNKTFVRIDGFQARLKVLPLLSREVEISKFVINRPEIFLEKGTNGTWNWQKLTEGSKPSTTPASETAKVPGSGDSKELPAQDSQKQGGFALQSLIVGEFSITDGRVQINDMENQLKREVSNFTLQLVDVSLDKPIKMTMEAVLDGKPLGLEGSVGPLGPDPLAGKINLDLVIKALETLNIKASGYLEGLKKQKTYKLAVNIEPFSPKRLFANLGLSFPVTTTDPQVLENVGFRATIAGDTTRVVVSDADILLDDSSVILDVTAKDFSRPDLAFNVEVDAIDIDRYLPPPEGAPGKRKAEVSKETVTQQTPATASSAKATSGGVKQKRGIDYGPLRKLVLEGTVKLKKVTVHGGTVENFALNVAGRDGLFTLNSLGMELYQGNIAATGKLNVQKDIPVTALNLSLQDVQVGPLLKDFAQKEIIEGKLKAEVLVNMKGDDVDLVKQSLNGKGDLLFQDGALIGLDLAQMARNIKSGFTLDQQGDDRPKTDFAELHAPFSITNGLVNTLETTLRSPFIRVAASGDANLVNEALDMKVTPTIVNTIKGQGDEEKRTGLTIPVLIGGTFKAPKFSPDLESLLQEQLPSEKELSEIIKTGRAPAERKEQLEEAKGLLKGLFGK